jgi:hypothetical protein
LRPKRPPLTIKQILAWADAHHARRGKWPHMDSGHVRDNLNEKWHNISSALRMGLRGLEGGSSLAKLLAKQRGVRNVRELPPLSEALIMKWADAHYARTGGWPNENSGAMVGAPPGEVWANVNAALSQGLRGLSGGSSLALLIAAKRGVRNLASVPPLTVKQILKWADTHNRRTSSWPACKDGPIDGVPGETWDAIDAALRQGCRGLPGESSLMQLLAEHRGVLNKANLPRLTKKQILAWADVHHERTGQWPQIESGRILDAHGETWSAINNALYSGFRGLPGGSSLPHCSQRSGRSGTGPVPHPSRRRKSCTGQKRIASGPANGRGRSAAPWWERPARRGRI